MRVSGGESTVINLLYRAQIEGIGGQTIERVSWHAQYFARPDLIGGILHRSSLFRISSPLPYGEREGGGYYSAKLLSLSARQECFNFLKAFASI